MTILSRYKKSRLPPCQQCRRGKLRTPGTCHLPRLCLLCRAVAAGKKAEKLQRAKEVAKQRKESRAKKFRTRRVCDRVAFNIQEWHTQ